ncbi:MAG: hypothetical protein ABL877_06750 [Thiobacillus sp.]
MSALNRFLTGCVMALTTVSLGACDMDKNLPDPSTEMVSKQQTPSHAAEFRMPTADYPALLSELDDLASKLQLRRYNAAPGLNELHGREVLFAAYGKGDPKLQSAALNVMDIDGPGKVLVWVYDDHFTDPVTRGNFIAAVSAIVERHGGKLGSYQTPGKVTGS